MSVRISSSATRLRVLAQHRRAVGRKLALICGLALLLLAGITLDVMTGPAGLSFREILNGLFGASGTDDTLRIIVWQVRLPTALLAVLIGAGLSLAGAEMQTILANPLASPFTLGVSSAAAFGAAIAIILGITVPFVPAAMAVPTNAFIMAFGSAMLIQGFAAAQGGAASLVLFGIALVFGFNALVAVLQFIAPADSLQQLVFWTMGSLNRADMVSVGAMAIVLALVAPFSLRAAWALTLLLLGEERARSLGVDLERLRFACLLRASLLAAVAVSFAGTIGFVGLVGPHIARLLVGEDHRFFLPAAILSGAVVMSFASVAAKLIIPGVLMPIGIVTSLIGLPFFVALLVAGRVVR
jgi:iron complex transport system permease protein